MICMLVFNLTWNCFPVQIVCSSCEDPDVGLAGPLGEPFGKLFGGVTTADVDLEGRVRTVFKVLIRHFLDSVSGRRGVPCLFGEVPCFFFLGREEGFLGGVPDFLGGPDFSLGSSRFFLGGFRVCAHCHSTTLVGCQSSLGRR